ncbi:MAG: helix-turn-helix domain-containing protein [Bacteroidia bacterium]
MTPQETEMQEDYISRINKVFQFIDQNPDGDLSLEAVSQVACFSPFHFHRIFKTMTGETLNEYVTRHRLEKAASWLFHRKNIPVTEIALQNGFSSNSAFTRAFKKFYGVSPTAFRNQNPHRFSKIRQIESKNGQAYPSIEQYICVIENIKIWTKMNAKIEVREVPAMNLAYVSCIGHLNVENAYHTLLRWATPKGLLDKPGVRMVTIYHDSFKITHPDKVRISACMVLDQPEKTSGEIGLTTIESGKCIAGSYEITLDEFEKAWTGLFMWMNENGYKKADRNPFEIFYNNFREHPEGKCIVDFFIPIE